ncbi:PAS domain S-box protein [Bizionia saleffrena]|uniref:histidine kinase n=1 Tax=Bizionia saleffrena TaxID=291189 RepID=A0A8H2LFB6_9FLAO|nr:HAMP domain-containing sensor histidine kinase [Bizionia saleffrena]TYB80275.1 PAS domain S-box protein [Bizionia saleffrena]
MKDFYKKLLSIDDGLNTPDDTTTFLNAIQESITIGAWEVDLETMRIYWSPMTKQIHEVDPDYVPKFDATRDFYTSFKDRDLLDDLFKTAVSTGKKYDIEYQLTTAKNNCKWVRSIGYPVFKEGICIKVMGIFQDITAKANIFHETIQKEKEIRTILTHSPNGMAVVGLHGGFLSVNKSLCDFLGYSEKELLSIECKTITHPKDYDKTETQISKLLDGRFSNFQLEKRYIHKSGKKIHGLLSTSLLRDENNVPLYFIKSVINIGPMRKANKTVEKLLKTTEDQNLRLLNFAHIVSHNLRSHTGNLSMLLELLQEDIPSATNNEYFPLIQQAVKNLADTVGNLNEISIVNSKKDTGLESLNLLDFTNKAINSSIAKIIETNTEINLNINSSIIVLALPAYLDSILLNIITNAIKYRRENIAPKITISASMEGKYIKLDISDNGLGINLDLHRHKMFGLYKTFHKHKDSRGLGLFITKNQIDAIGGKIDVISEVNKGSTFTVYFKYENN